MTMTQKIIDRIAATIDQGKVRAKFAEDLEEEPFSQLREWADHISEVANQIEVAIAAVGTWQDAERGDEKTDARDEAIDELQALVDLWASAPIDMSLLEEYSSDE